MITRIKARNGGITLHDDELELADHKVGWSRTPMKLAEMIVRNGGLADFVSGYGMEQGLKYGFATDMAPDDMWGKTLQILKANEMILNARDRS